MESDNANCQILGTTGLIVQLVLGFLCFMVLLVKRHVEKPKRLLKIFLMDTTKQVFSQLLQHFLNVALAIFISSSSEDDACIWYFITYIMDTTLGVFFCYLMITFFEKAFEARGSDVYQSLFYYQPKKFKTGNYYTISYPNIATYAVSSENTAQIKKSKPKVVIDYKVYILQLLLWMFIVLTSKTFLYFLQVLFAQGLQTIADFIFSPIKDDPNAELIIIMVVVPLIMNSICFWVQDNFLKKTSIKKEERDLLMGVIYENDANGQGQAKEKAEVQIEFQQMQPKPNQIVNDNEKIEIVLDDQILNENDAEDKPKSVSGSQTRAEEEKKNQE